MLSQQLYNLNDEQSAKTQEIMQREVMRFLKEHEDEVWPIIRELLGAKGLALGGLPATAELWGPFTSRLIWSTGWNAFVSVVLTARVYQRFEAAVESVNDGRVTSTFTTRVRVRP